MKDAREDPIPGNGKEESDVTRNQNDRYDEKRDDRCETQTLVEGIPEDVEHDKRPSQHIADEDEEVDDEKKGCHRRRSTSSISPLANSFKSLSWILSRAWYRTDGKPVGTCGIARLAPVSRLYPRSG